MTVKSPLNHKSSGLFTPLIVRTGTQWVQTMAGLQAGMPQPALDGADIVAGLQQVGGKGVKVWAVTRLGMFAFRTAM